MKVVIIIPTYNEAGNIERLISEINTITRLIPHIVNLLVVDDNSPDGTGQHVRNLMERHPNVHLITGKKKGLGSAYIRGITHAINSVGADAIMEMDADFSHKPGDIGRLLAGLGEADFVIGSRYINGGKIPENWAYIRKLNSKLGNMFARYIVGLMPIRDCTAGFRAIKTSLLKNINVSTIRTRGYSFQIDLLHKAVIQGARVLEIPVDFVDRSKGESKLGIKDIVEFFIFVWVIRLESHKTFLKFTIAALTGLSLSFLLFSILLEIGISNYLASAISIVSMISSSYCLNKKWTFSTSNKLNQLKIKGLNFNRIFYPSFLVAYAIFMLLSLIWPNTLTHVVQTISLVSSVLISYFLVSYSK